jgi:hypothetical protein
MLELYDKGNFKRKTLLSRQVNKDQGNNQSTLGRLIIDFFLILSFLNIFLEYKIDK